jgi:hypothetical protein
MLDVLKTKSLQTSVLSAILFYLFANPSTFKMLKKVPGLKFVMNSATQITQSGVVINAVLFGIVLFLCVYLINSSLIKDHLKFINIVEHVSQKLTREEIKENIYKDAITKLSGLGDQIESTMKAFHTAEKGCEKMGSTNKDMKKETASCQKKGELEQDLQDLYTQKKKLMNLMAARKAAGLSVKEFTKMLARDKKRREEEDGWKSGEYWAEQDREVGEALAAN